MTGKKRTATGRIDQETIIENGGQIEGTLTSGNEEEVPARRGITSEEDPEIDTAIDDNRICVLVEGRKQIMVL